jgi:hypothetical protein
MTKYKIVLYLKKVEVEVEAVNEEEALEQAREIAYEELEIDSYEVDVEELK